MSALWLVCDVSGSMLESGKRLTVRNLVRQVEQFCRYGYLEFDEVCVIAWSDTTAIVDWNVDDEVPPKLLDCGGSASGDALERQVSDSSWGGVLIFTDGHWSDECRRSVVLLQNEHGEKVRIVKIGSDANPRLGGPYVFTAEEVFEVLDGWARL